ncbi:amidase [Pseudodonghicola flavimaris]|uniref:Amidase n=1 Tax=Pseudodonghicola flavimaris TaxID=3050036 RepID=A0ABT7EVI4_9RHOB|nr:amidase [Pseudodonghicola flavimaris]MDK3016304.1 amidase [Pseudodonghicola flavimaris]
MTLTRESATRLLADLAAHRLSAAELMEATLARIDAVNPAVNAIVALRDRDDLMAEARAADQAPRRGPLHGLPIAVKDLVDVAGIVSSHGSPNLANFVPKADDILAARLRAAGAILIGKTNVPEFGLGSHTFNPVYGATVNPYDTSLSCGGSSGGAAVALATGMTALADGSDMMGSLRNPAAWNNVYGYRPSWGLVPSEPRGDTFLHQLATLGPMARSPEDIAVLLDVIAGPDPRQPHGVPHQPIAPLEPATLKGLRIGWLGDWGGAYAMEAGILDLCDGAVKVFEELGAHVEELTPPFSSAALWDSWITLRSWQVGMGLAPLMEQPAQRAKLKDSAIWETERGLAMSAAEVHRASVTRSEWFRKAAALFEDYDALILPTAQAWPFDVDQPWPAAIAGRPMDTYHRWMEVVIPISLIGLPALAVPGGFGAQGLPMGIQIFGRRGADRQMLAIGAAYHAATQWPQKRPAM